MADQPTKSSEREKMKALALEQLRVFAELARRRLSPFAIFVDKKAETAWFHKLIYDYLDKWVAGDIKKLAIFMPPQHGKSDMSSVKTPGKILGQKPSANVVVASYSDANASKFCRKTQNIMDTPEFKHLFPGVVLPAKGIETTNELRNNTYFETVKHKGSYKAVSIGGSLTGFPIDYGIIDDPIKDRKQANSPTYRNALWDWFHEVWRTRMHNDSSELLLFTRWHEDDLAGRLFDPKNKYYDPEEAAQWTVIAIPAIKEATKPIKAAIDVPDPRAVGDALWPTKHNAEKYMKRKRNNPQSFASLDQQRPSPAEGNKIKKDWFQRIKLSELPFNPAHVKMDFWIDGAFTDKMENDETATMACVFYKKNLYIFNCHGVRMELNEYLDYIGPWMRSMGYKGTSTVYIELKAAGYGFYSMLKQQKHGGFNCVKVNPKVVQYGKMTRVENSQPTLASGRVFLVDGPWCEAFIDQCGNFPNDVHDDMVDDLTYAVHQYFINGENGVEVTYS